MKINYCCLDYYSNVVLFLSLMTKTSEDKKMVTDHWDLSYLKVLNMDENDNNWAFLLIYDLIEYVQLIDHLKKILHDMFSNDKHKIDCLLKLKEYIEVFDIVNIQVLDILLNMNVVEKINKQEKNEEVMHLVMLLNQIEVENNLIRNLVR